MNSMFFSTHWKWHKLFSYGEVICFVTAWAIGLLVARDSSPSADQRMAGSSFAVTSESPGVQVAAWR